MKKIIVLMGLGLFAGTLVFGQGTKGQAKSSAAAPAATSETSEKSSGNSGLKLGWLNSAALLDGLPEKTKADSDIAKYAKSFQELIEEMGKEYQSKLQQYQKDEKGMSDAIKEVKQKEIQDLGNRIQTTEQSAQDKISQKKQEIYGPILEKADKAIKAVAKEQGYDYIFDAGAGGGALLFARDSDNITQIVRTKMTAKK
jgi:outer membrane protein